MSVQMIAATPYLSRLLKAAHRRATLFHVAERMGTGLFAGAILVLILIALLTWMGNPSSGWVLLTMPIMAAGGLIWGIVRRPSLLSTAARADDQLQTDDLLATAAAFRSASDDPWQHAVIWIADQRCRAVSASAVTLHRLSARMWCVFALSASIAIVVSVLMSSQSESTAHAGDSEQRVVAKNLRPQSVERPLIVLAPDSPLQPNMGGQAVDEPPENDPEPAVAPAASQPDTQSPPPNNAESSGNSGSVGPDGTGDGSSKQARPTPTTRPGNVAMNATTQSSPPTAVAATQPAGGTGVGHSANPDAAGPTGMVGGASGNSSRPPRAPGETLSTSESARKLLDAGRIPADRRDLVRKYFDLD